MVSGPDTRLSRKSSMWSGVPVQTVSGPDNRLNKKFNIWFGFPAQTAVRAGQPSDQESQTLLHLLLRQLSGPDTVWRGTPTSALAFLPRQPSGPDNHLVWLSCPGRTAV